MDLLWGRAVLSSAWLLTRRESECLEWLSSGCRYDVIADRLSVSEATVRFHLANARKKLKAATREQAVARAIHLELIRP